MVAPRTALELSQGMNPFDKAPNLAFELDVRRIVHYLNRLPGWVDFLRHGVTERLRKLSIQLHTANSVLARKLDTEAPAGVIDEHPPHHATHAGIKILGRESTTWPLVRRGNFGQDRINRLTLPARHTVINEHVINQTRPQREEKFHHRIPSKCQIPAPLSKKRWGL